MAEDRPVSPETDRLHPSLERLLTAQIQRDGSIPLDSFMQQVLSHPEFGYYTQMQTIGAEGDFITAPEISQLFGEIAAAFLAHIWMLYEQPPASDISNFRSWHTGMAPCYQICSGFITPISLRWHRRR